jgi:hypothetical protein
MPDTRPSEPLDRSILDNLDAPKGRTLTAQLAQPLTITE